jgi:signal transduction histidine kinase
VRPISRTLAARRTIRTKILAIAWVPSLVLLLVGVVVAGVLARQSANEDTFTTNYAKALQLGSQLAAADQVERQLTVTYLLDRGGSRQSLDAQRLKTDDALAKLTPLLSGIEETGSDSFVNAITSSGASVGGLPQLRQAVDSGALTALAAAGAYSQTLAVFHVAFENLATSAATAKIASEYELTASLFQLAEWRSESQIFEQAIFSRAGLSDQEFGTFADRVGGYHSLLTTTVPRLPVAEQAQFKALTSSPAWRQLSRVENIALRTGSSGEATGEAAVTHRATLPISQGAWDAASAQASQELIDQYLTHGTYSTGLANDHVHGLLIRSLAAGIGLLLLSLLVFAIVTRMSNRLIRRLRQLRTDTLEVASQRLPTIVERLGRGEPVDLERELPPLDHGTDEIGQVADAFNQAQRTAVAAAGKEAETRAGTAKVFLNIAHRSQIVAHRQLKLLDQAERTQEDPDQLSLLFQLDHLTTRSRRNAENLIILGGGQPGRRWRNPVPLLDVVRSAVGEAETYTGITIGQIPDVSVSGKVVADIIHLLAELVDNATSFSPPTARVEVRGNLAGRGVVIEIEDQGLGIEPDQLEELNRTLQKSPDFGVMALSDEPRLGLFVVTQLAVRHGVRVTLTESRSYGGIRAVVLIPLDLISGTEPMLSELESGAASDPLDLQDPLPPGHDVIGTVLPTRKASRMISRATAQAPVVEPRSVEVPPVEAPPVEEFRSTGVWPSESWPSESWSTESPSTQSLTADPLALSEPLALREPLAQSLRTAMAGSGMEGERHTAEIPVVQAPVPNVTEWPGSAFPQEPAPFSTDRQQRPALPRRIKQTHLAPQLFEDGRPAAATPPGPSGPVETLPTAESARDRMAAFQFGTRRGRQNDFDPDS